MGDVATQSLPAALRREGPCREVEKASPPGWYIPRNAVYEPSLPPPCGHERPADPPPKLKPRAKTWDRVRDGGPDAQETSAESVPRVLSRRIRVYRLSLPRRLGIFAGTDLQV